MPEPTLIDLIEQFNKPANECWPELAKLFSSTITISPHVCGGTPKQRKAAKRWRKGQG